MNVCNSLAASFVCRKRKTYYYIIKFTTKPMKIVILFRIFPRLLNIKL